MPEVRFYLKGEPNRSGRRLIMAKYFVGGQLMTITTKCRIEPEHWNTISQRPRKSYPQRVELNAVIDRIEQDVRTAEMKLRAAGKEPTRALMREQLATVGRIGKKDSDVVAYTLEQKRFSKPVYQNLVSQITVFTLRTKRGSNFDEITVKWYRAFEAYLSKQSLTDNYISQLLSALKAVIRQAASEEITDNTVILLIRGSFSTTTEGKIPLTLEEVLQFSKTKVASEQDERIRDAFVLGCLSGLRHGDWHRFDLKNVTTFSGREYIQVFNSKTAHFVHIPLFPVTRALLEKYGGSITPPPYIRCNEALKVIAREAGFTDTVQRIERRAGTAVQVQKLRWQMFTTHSARATFNSALRATGMPDHLIQEITGHNSGSKKNMTSHYDRRNFEQKAEQMETYLQKIESVFHDGSPISFI